MKNKIAILAAIVFTVLFTGSALAVTFWPANEGYANVITYNYVQDNSDNYTGGVQRRSTVETSAYGDINRVSYQFNSSTGRYRPGIYNKTFNVFTNSGTGWLTLHSSSTQFATCSQGLFYGLFPLETIYGPVSWGYLYKKANNIPYVATATYSIPSGTCATDNVWRRAYKG